MRRNNSLGWFAPVLSVSISWNKQVNMTWLITLCPVAPGSDWPADPELRRQAGIPQWARALIVAVTARPSVMRSCGTVQRQLQPLLNSPFWDGSTFVKFMGFGLYACKSTSSYKCLLATLQEVVSLLLDSDYFVNIIPFLWNMVFFSTYLYVSSCHKSLCHFLFSSSW